MTKTIQKRIESEARRTCADPQEFIDGASLMLWLILEELRIHGHVFVMNNYDMADWIEKKAKE